VRATKRTTKKSNFEAAGGADAHGGPERSLRSLAKNLDEPLPEAERLKVVSGGENKAGVGGKLVHFEKTEYRSKKHNIQQ